ncbi:hypothetical protein CRG98_049760, partial [Punica granatum]
TIRNDLGGRPRLGRSPRAFGHFPKGGTERSLTRLEFWAISRVDSNRFSHTQYVNRNNITCLSHCAHPNFISSGLACAKLMQRGLGVSTFPWGCATDAREKESPLSILRPEGREPASYPGLR